MRLKGLILSLLFLMVSSLFAEDEYVKFMVSIGHVNITETSLIQTFNDHAQNTKNFTNLKTLYQQGWKIINTNTMFNNGNKVVLLLVMEKKVQFITNKKIYSKSIKAKKVQVIMDKKVQPKPVKDSLYY